MVLKLIPSWNAAAGAEPFVAGIAVDDEAEQALDYDDPLAILIREHKAEKRKRQDQEAASEHRLEQRQKSEIDKQDQEERRLRDRLASEHYRHAVETLSADIDDARQAASWALKRAQAEQQQARAALEQARRNALVIDGDRVYLTRDGRRMYGEDDLEITDSAAFAEARYQHRNQPSATHYEDFVERRTRRGRADDNVETLCATLERLDNLERRVKQGHLSPEDLETVRREQQDIISSLPLEAREKYERLHAARQDANSLSYQAADPAFAAAPDLATNFQRAGAIAAQSKSEDRNIGPPTNYATPVYKSAPDF